MSESRGTEPDMGLVAVLERFLVEARQVVADLDRSGPLQPAAEVVAQLLSDLPAYHELGAAARSAAVANEYEMAAGFARRRSGGSADRSYGRPLTRTCLSRQASQPCC